MTKVRVRFNADIPFHLENKLINKHGFSVIARKHREWVMLEKPIAPQFKNPLDASTLSEHFQTQCIKDCNRIVNWYGPNPEQATTAIRIRLDSLASSRPSLERQFILEWMERNFPTQSDPKEETSYSVSEA
jgi:hypothetical protein